MRRRFAKYGRFRFIGDVFPNRRVEFAMRKRDGRDGGEGFWYTVFSGELSWTGAWFVRDETILEGVGRWEAAKSTTAILGALEQSAIWLREMSDDNPKQLNAKWPERSLW